MNIILTEHISLEDIHAEGHETIQNYSERKMMRFIHLFQEICSIGFYYLGKDQVQIYSKKLQRISKDYTVYVDLLEKLRLLKVNPYYMPDEQCKSYSYTPLYTQKYFLYKIDRERDRKILINDIVNNNIKKKKFNNSDGSDSLEERLNEFFCHLNFDTNAASAFSEELKNERAAKPEINLFAKGWLQTSTGKWYKGTKPTPKDIGEQQKYELWQIDKWDDRYFSGFRDQTSRRFHSILTTLSKEFRQFITFGAAKEKLYNLDIKNSQPFFSLVLMNPSFWYYPEMPEEYKKIYAKYFEEPASPSKINIKTVGMENEFPVTIYTYIIKSISQLGEDYTVYKDSVLAGRLYENIQIQYQEKLDLKMERDDIKTSLFTTFFSSNRFRGQKSAAPKNMFSKISPTVYQVFSAIKKGYGGSEQSSSLIDKPHSRLSILLQRIESFTILDVITNAIINKHTDIPVYTIHDSICSIEKYMPIIQRVFEEKILEFTGFVPAMDLKEL